MHFQRNEFLKMRIVLRILVLILRLLQSDFVTLRNLLRNRKMAVTRMVAGLEPDFEKSLPY